MTGVGTWVGLDAGTSAARDRFRVRDVGRTYLRTLTPAVLTRPDPRGSGTEGQVEECPGWDRVLQSVP